MLRRIVVALSEGTLIGALGGVAALSFGGGPPSWTTAHGAAAFTGALTGLVAGKPVWKLGSGVEAAIRVFAGIFLAIATLFGVRKWLSAVTLNLGVAGSGPLGDVLVVSLPLIAVAIAIVLEIDDAVGADPVLEAPSRGEATPAPSTLGESGSADPDRG